MDLAQKKIKEQVLTERTPKITVRKITKKKTKTISFQNMMVVVLFVLTFLLVIKNYVTIYDLSTKNRQLQETLNQSLAQRDYIKTTIYQNMSMERIESIARNSLGMEFPTSDQIIYQDLTDEK